jgi:hypothetical protein
LYYWNNFGEHGSDIIDGLLPVFFKSGEEGQELGRDLGGRAGHEQGSNAVKLGPKHGAAAELGCEHSARRRRRSAAHKHRVGFGRAQAYSVQISFSYSVFLMH